MKITKCFVTLQNIATISCPNCRKSKDIDAEKYREKNHTIKIRCSCRYHFAVQLDFRRHYRKETNLDGIYVMEPPTAGTGKLNILNISRSGVGFTIGFSVEGSHNIKPGHKIKINFQLDNKKRTQIEKVITVKNVEGHYVGGEFDLNKAFEKDLGFYLQP